MHKSTVVDASNDYRRRVLLMDFDGPICPLHRNTTSLNPTFRAFAGRVCHEAFSGEAVGQCHVEVSNYAAFDCFFRVLRKFPNVAVLIGSQRLAGKSRSPNSMLYFSYYEMVHSLKFLFPRIISDAKIQMSDRLAENVDALDLNDTKLPLLLNCKRLKNFTDLQPEDICLLDDYAGYGKDAKANGFHFISCRRQPQDECHGVKRSDIRLLDRRGNIVDTSGESQSLIPDGTHIRARYPGKLYDKDTFYSGVVVRSSLQLRKQGNVRVYVVQYIPDRLSEVGYLFEALKWLTRAEDEELHSMIRRCGSQHAALLANLFCEYSNFEPQLAHTKHKRADDDVECCVVM